MLVDGLWDRFAASARTPVPEPPAYRDNEVGLAHPLTRTLEGLHASGTKIQNIILQPLTQKDVECLVSESVRCEPDCQSPGGTGL